MKNYSIGKTFTLTKQNTNNLISEKRVVGFEKSNGKRPMNLSLFFLKEPRSLISQIDFSRNSNVFRYKHCFLLLEGVD